VLAYQLSTEKRSEAKAKRREKRRPKTKTQKIGQIDA
jgi:hypothetical protein